MLSTQSFSKLNHTRSDQYDNDENLNSGHNLSEKSPINMRSKISNFNLTTRSDLSLPPIDNRVPYKITSKINNNRSQVRFSIPDPNLVNDDCSYISISNSPQKIVFPKEPIENAKFDDGELTSIYSDPLTTFPNYHRDPKSPIKKVNKIPLKDRLNLVDLQTKVMIDVPESIWKYHRTHRSKEDSNNNNSNNKDSIRGHRKTKSMHNIYNPYRDVDAINKSNISPETHEWTPFHQKSKSLQSIIAETVKIYNEEEQAKSNEDISLSTFNETVSTISPLNIRQPGRYTKITKKHDLFLTSESPLNKYKVSVPLEINLPPYLSPHNKDKNYHRRSLIYNGQGYSTFNTDSEETISESEISESIHEDSKESDFVTDSLIGDDSLPYATNNISIDVGNKTVKDTDLFLGIDEEANVNLKVQNKNIRSNSKPPKQPPLPAKDTQFKSSTSINNDITSPHTKSLQQSYSRPTSDALEILATPSKSIVIPCLDDEDYQTPKVPSTNGSLKFFENFEPLSNEEQDTFNTDKYPRRVEGKLNLAFKFPFNETNNQVAERRQVNPTDETMDFLKVAQKPSDPEFENRRQRLIHNQSANNSPVHKSGHAHRRTQSIHNIEFTTFDSLTTPQASVDAASTPQKESTTELEIPVRSQFRNQTSVIVESPIIKITPPHKNTQDSIVFISERIISSSPKPKVCNGSRPLSSIQSFSKPVSYKDVGNMHSSENILMPEDVLDSKTVPIKNFNSLSPRRSLSNNGSHQSSSVTSYTNSQFSKASYNSTETDMEAVEEIEEIELIKRSNIPVDVSFSLKEKKEENDISFEIIKEYKNGKEVDVIVLNDVEESANDTSKRKRKLKSTRITKNKDYNAILDMCENTASEAKDIIYKLVSETEPLNVNESGKKNMHHTSQENEQRERYLKKFNRTMRVTSKIK
ncbi:similar to Saccharomyces cerevisiae YER032W FIR1 Protein involved in 3' mRNA processing, interacts with Ref2p [Maudiozyma barnettii]|uniref:Similar to Saccharomyces cerevisiae YER032W FIR1 Protein involved in 3' mRNA processing, interacts with Ref2p n=1 Tax=Maudiozyma barnettii TaxID=61262 RepID=A0A8H2VD23_9SACH|nr:similar to Saccharomyces cerevisiae YER032W FIR1 Protein involved in 3' mRNA processing, interacts with Ref2p [Kazachstania barnettii]CAB4253023.1 similar to Saccharomyces cerevisiae YER032W FIR1 Protein involved in 3' mRNA processing, interacts with Ref2p [Kazachstania barnettii]CAD1780442.1 similar to Saccharomyces cerevisiae YER032W FIR1 Protein involved in 3' mRNA processing, interacts with Ref2p [Kazachstania barnettii]